MLILGLQFGHDASVTILRDGEVLSHVSRERVSGVKHALGLNSHCIELALKDACVRLSDIDFCAVTSTQSVELIFEGDVPFNISYGETNRHKYPSTLVRLDKLVGTTPESRLGHSVIAGLKGEVELPGWMLEQLAVYFPAFKNQSEQIRAVPTMDNFISYEHWNEGAGLKQIAERNVRTMLSESNRRAYHYPLTLEYQSCTIPGYFVHHHMCHASASYYLSSFETAGIFSHDGFSNGTGYNSGLFYFAIENRIYPLSPHHLNIGGFYDRVGIACGLNQIGPAGKLMGLAGYGKPVYYSDDFVGNYYDFAELRTGSLVDEFLKSCNFSAGVELDPGWDEVAQKPFIENKNYADIAASAQAILEQTRLRAVDTLHQLLLGSEIYTDNLCITGGTALNCPSNTSLFHNSKFKNHFIEPCCDDGGLSIGAALNLYHNIADNKRIVKSHSDQSIPFVGIRYNSSDIRQAIEANSNSIIFEELAGLQDRAVEDLMSQKVIALCVGRSELGPRALGHRSILADPTNRSMLRKINKLKNREVWRPFAPMVLKDYVDDCFIDGPEDSSFMLYNYLVQEGYRNSAVSHIDDTARVQTVDENFGCIYKILSLFNQLSGLPFLLNTSFNGKDKPIVETPLSAIEAFLSLDIDVLYLENYRIVRAP